ncbi:hypothetical protein ASE05_10385 [Mesorhizobium sp. Root172]|nr:hypothetical protein ASE05_10385 [Mesorhizobium sp. Root172]
MQHPVAIAAHARELIKSSSSARFRKRDWIIVVDLDEVLPVIAIALSEGHLADLTSQLAKRSQHCRFLLAYERDVALSILVNTEDFRTLGRSFVEPVSLGSELANNNARLDDANSRFESKPIVKVAKPHSDFAAATSGQPDSPGSLGIRIKPPEVHQLHVNAVDVAKFGSRRRSGSLSTSLEELRQGHDPRIILSEGTPFQTEVEVESEHMFIPSPVGILARSSNLKAKAQQLLCCIAFATGQFISCQSATSPQKFVRHRDNRFAVVVHAADDQEIVSGALEAIFFQERFSALRIVLSNCRLDRRSRQFFHCRTLTSPDLPFFTDRWSGQGKFQVMAG